MEIVRTKRELREKLRPERRKGKVIGFVPTMGYLHEGHLSLMRKAREDSDIVVVSIFVNPTQFGEGEDYETYPRDLERDAKLAQEAGADLIFFPDVKEMYGEGSITYVDMTGLTDTLCGASRPGHFRGVMTVVAKLFNIVDPNKAYFGQKDAQQVAVLKKMVEDLDFNVDIVEMPIVREKDGLAMSSRNTYLNGAQREAALAISRSLFEARSLIEAGERDASRVKERIVRKLSSSPMILIDYVELVDAGTLKSIQEVKGSVLIAVAVKIGDTRLIDNVKLEV